MIFDGEAFNFHFLEEDLLKKLLSVSGIREKEEDFANE
jgi:hypothetical protein